MHRSPQTLLAALGLAAVVLCPATAAAALRAGTRQPVVVRVDEGFRWLDAGIGALVALGVVALLAGFVLIARKGPIVPPKGER